MSNPDLVSMPILNTIPKPGTISLLFGSSDFVSCFVSVLISGVKVRVCTDANGAVTDSVTVGGAGVVNTLIGLAMLTGLNTFA